MQLRYTYRASPDATQRRGLAKAFGCARVVWNDCLRDRKEAHAAGLPYVKSAELSRLRLTQAKRTEERTRLAKSVHDAGWSAFIGMLEHKAALHGRTFTKVDRAFPSSQICSACGLRNGPKPLHVREWTCGECATVHDRDHNAARNVLFEGRRIVAAGRAETLNACGAPVRRAPVPAQRGEAGSPRKGQTTQAGIPGL
ncbi:zinc ribbon domain-containing protein [Streptomyces sp. NPDC020742]|uniref:zinc ribbon domain-containing protein n=1 Tax=Streptomyces sp. NPDC020742 TaxID=3154897 RepID=UPI0033F9899C